MLKREKIRELWNQISLEIKNTILKYPCTMSVIALATILAFLCIDDIDGVIIDYILPFFVWFSVGIYFSESAFAKKLPLKIGCILITAVLSGFLVYQYRYFDTVLFEDTWTVRIRTSYIIFCVAMGIYYSYRRSGLLLPQFAIRVFSNLVKVHIIYAILNIGALSVGLIIQALFLGNDFYFDVFGRMLILVIGFFYVPSTIYAFSETEKREDAFSEILVKYVLFPLTILIFAIIYLYVIKIFILRNVPSNELFSILAGLFILAMPTWTMMESIEKGSFWHKISVKLPLLFIPLVFFQIYSIGVRIGQYGVTPDRYLGVMWILLEIIYLVIYYRFHRYTGRMFGVIAAAFVIALLFPGVNMYHISAFSQQKIMEQYRSGGELSEETKQKIYGAYSYLVDLEDSEKFIDEKYTSEEIEEIKEFYSAANDRYYSSDISIGTEERVNNLDISGYSKMQIVQYNMNYGDPAPNLKHLGFVISEKEEVILYANLKETIEGYIDYGLEHIEDEEHHHMDKEYHHVDIDDYYLKHCRVDLKDEKGSVLYIRYFDITYDKEAGEIEDLDLTAYLFQ